MSEYKAISTSLTSYRNGGKFPIQKGFFFNQKAKTKNFKGLNENTVMVTFTEFSLETILARRNNVY